MAVEPLEFPPPVKPAEEFMHRDHRSRGGADRGRRGDRRRRPRGLACAIKLMQLLEDEPELTEKLGEVPVAVVEKGKTPGAHLLSGANMKPLGDAGALPGPRPVGLARLSGGHQGRGLPPHQSKMALPLKPMPPNFRNHGNYVTSVAKLGRFLAEKAEEAGVYILSETAADKLLVEDRHRSRGALGRQGPRQGRVRSSPTSSPAPTSSPRRPSSRRARSGI